MVHSLPDLLAGILITAYWARALRLAWKMRLQTGIAANWTPPEALGRRLRMIWRPLVVFWIVHLFINAFTGEFHLPWLLKPLAHSAILAWLSVTIIAAGVLATLVCWKRMGKSWRMGINPDEKTQLIITGPYAYIRHPIYAIQSVMILATMALLPSPLMLAAGILMLTFLQWEARREEKYLVVHHGNSYVEYCHRTGGFLPRSLRAYRPA